MGDNPIAFSTTIEGIGSTTIHRLDLDTRLADPAAHIDTAADELANDG